ncbi:Ig-like domain-containing protein [Candidatus Bathyarchaeota archaeon]|nr:Ig-like domain-containing protein [Candidatus Bathyarchaeota archaeon]
MMKMSRKYSIVAVALIALMCAGTAYALITIWSPPVNVNLQYTVTMTGAPYTEYRLGQGMALCARVLDSSGQPVKDITVDFYASADGGSSYSIVGSGVSNNDGHASFLWTEAGAYNYWFKAYCAI